MKENERERERERGKGGERIILDVAVLASWNTTALNNLTTAAGTTEEDGVGSLGPLDGKLIKCIYGTTSLDDSGACSLCEVQGTHFEGREIHNTKVISNSSHYHCNFVCSLVEALD